MKKWNNDNYYDYCHNDNCEHIGEIEWLVNLLISYCLIDDYFC